MKTMKRLFSVIAIASFLMGGVAFADYDESGAIRNKKLEHPGLNSDPVKVIQLVRFPECGANALPLSAGDVVIWDLVSDDGVSVNLTTTSMDAAAGVCIGAIPTADSTTSNTAIVDTGKRNWGYVQIYGVTTCKVDASSITAGDGLRVSALARRAGTVEMGSVAGGNLGGATLGFAYDTSSATGETADVFVKTE